MKKRSYYGINEHFEDIFNAVRECKMTFAYSSYVTVIATPKLGKMTSVTSFEIRGTLSHDQAWVPGQPNEGISRFT